ncbi:MAG TPA: histidine kinase [Solirubrobacteraceae bacterium]|jgi:signal transduction histidine kinase|nr:histidine kinase [Solirubrobacteraceae bacterium]
MRALLDRIADLDAKRVDAVLAAAIIGELELESWLAHGVSDADRLLTAVAAVLFASPIAVRRRWPAGALVFCSAVAVIQELLGVDLGASNGVLLVPVVLAYSVGAWLDPRRSLGAVILGYTLFGGFVLLADTNLSSSGEIAADVFFACLLFAAPWFLGRLVREHGRRAAAFGELAVQAGAEQRERERAAIAQERVRIGGELQDIVAHSVSAMVIQAGGARRLLRSDPERARDSILTVEQTGREALADMRRLLGMLRKDDDPRALAPQPGLDQLATLLDSVREAGLACELRSEGEPIDLTPGIDLVGYRVIEEVLTRAARHRCRGAVVNVRYRPDRLELDIRGEGSIPDLDEDLRGMSERVALYDGSLGTVAVGGDAFALQAQLPLGAAVAT